MRWEFLREEEFPSAIEKAGGLCVIPIGCLEMHGEHLPVGTDSLKAHALAVLAAEKTGAVVFPTAMWLGDVMGVHKLEKPWEKKRAGYISLSPELLMQILKELCDEIGRNGFRKILLLSSHGGNDPWLSFFDRAVRYTQKDYAVMWSKIDLRDLDADKVLLAAKERPEEFSMLTEEDRKIVMDQYEKLAELMLKREREGKPFTFYHYMIDLSDGPCIYKRISGCGSGTEYMAVTPWGDLYPCHQFVGDEKFKLGNIWEGVTNTAIQGEFAACNVYAHPECRDCWARLYCSGGCAANAYHSTGSVTGVYEYGCKLFRKRMECAIMVAIHRALGK